MDVDSPHVEECTHSDIPCMVPQHSQVQSHVKGAVKYSVSLELEDLKADVTLGFP